MNLLGSLHMRFSLLKADTFLECMVYNLFDLFSSRMFRLDMANKIPCLKKIYLHYMEHNRWLKSVYLVQTRQNSISLLSFYKLFLEGKSRISHRYHKSRFYRLFRQMKV